MKSEPAGSDDSRKSVLAELERIVGNQTYNARIQNRGPNGTFMGEGREYRYPVTVIDSQGRRRKIYGKIDAAVSMEELRSAYYGFGANNLHIGLALQKVLAYLEGNYGLDVSHRKGSVE